ncbi:uncharacterized protein LOC125235034 [Leguminivora glycinivorella]|uniref:uncharacterized protein LOC125235034 n=1 Tax=Leguminivora glycinivorella TaxID=1035111 RepID=UPI00200CC63E|nr:uncharacterized protein LOC125235034 [Leguminivora glycinivorella]
MSDRRWAELTNSKTVLMENQRKTWAEKSKGILKDIRNFWIEVTVEPCLFTYMLCTALSSFAVQNMHLEKSCRVNLNYGTEICDRIRDRNVTGLDEQIKNIETLVAHVVAWKFPLQTAIPAVMVLFVGAWSDKNKKRKICILFPMIGEIIANSGLLLATYYFHEVSLTATVLIEALPAAFTGSYIIIFMGMYSFMADRTSVESRTFRLGLVSICISLGTPVGTVLSGVLLRILGYYGIFSLLLVLHVCSFLYGVLKLEDVVSPEDDRGEGCDQENKFKRAITEVFGLVVNTMMVAFKPRASGGRLEIFLILGLYIIMVGPLYGDSQVSYLYAIRRFNFSEVEYSLYGTINIVLGLVGTFFCISVLSKKFQVEDSIIGSLAGVSRIAACFVFAFAPTRQWYYSAPLFNIFSGCGLTALRSIATKSVPSQEVAKLSSLIGVTEAIAPSIYMPTSSLIYVNSMDTFPGAFYLFDASLTVVALGLFVIIYILVKRRQRNRVINPVIKEQFARDNPTLEVSRI